MSDKLSNRLRGKPPASKRYKEVKKGAIKGRGPNLLDNSKFQSHQKNKLSLLDDSNLDSNLKSIKIGDEISPIMVSKSKVNINTVDTSNIRLSGDCTISGGAGVNIQRNIPTSEYTSKRIQIKPGDPNGVSGDSAYIKLEGYDQDDYLTIEHSGNKEASIKTIDEDSNAAHLTVDSDGDIILDSATGNITAKDNGGNYTPSSDYHVATKKYVDEKKQKHFMQWSMRWSTDANPANSGTNRRRWFTPQITYGPNDYIWDSYQTATNPRTSWYDSMTPSIVVPSDMTLVRYALYGSITWQSASDTGTILLELKKNTNPLTWNSTAQSIPLTTVGTRQSATWGHQMYTRMQESVNVSMSEGDILIPSLARDSFLTSSSSRYIEGNFVLEFEKALV